MQNLLVLALKFLVSSSDNPQSFVKGTPCPLSIVILESTCLLESSFLLIIMATLAVGIYQRLLSFHNLFAAEQFGDPNTVWGF